MPNLSIHTAGRVCSHCKNIFEQDPQILDRDYLIEHTSHEVIGRQSSEISQLENNKKTTAKYKSVPKATASGRTNKPSHQQCCWNE